MEDLLTRGATAEIRSAAAALAKRIAQLPLEARVEALNAARQELHKVSPFADQPVDLVTWEPAGQVYANDYNPNRVAPPEMRLLELSIASDGFTQPIVAHRETADRNVVVDGFHRSRVGKESKRVHDRVHGYLPLVHIRAEQDAAEKRMASTIRHNRARGKHTVEPMTGIVSYLSKKGWDDAKVAQELGMEPDEVLRFKQITGLAELFKGHDFSEAWDVDQ